MANPHPVQTEEFLEWQHKITQKRQGEVSPDDPLGKTIGVRLPQSIDRVVRTIPEQSDWLRQIVGEAARRDFPERFLAEVSEG